MQGMMDGMMSAASPPEKRNPVLEEYSRLAEDYDSK